MKYYQLKGKKNLSRVLTRVTQLRRFCSKSRYNTRLFNNLICYRPINSLGPLVSYSDVNIFRRIFEGTRPTLFIEN